MIRLILTPAAKIGNFIARLEDGTFICESSQPAADGARVLQKSGFDPEGLMTTRYAGKPFDNFMPHRISLWASVTYSEGKQGLRREKWRPNPLFPAKAP